MGLDQLTGTGVTTLVYIGGYGRSGSTLLEALLTTSPDVVACGETVNARRLPAHNMICSCGKMAPACPIWGPLIKPSRQIETWNHREIDKALFESVSANCAVMVDSSKTAWGHALAPFKLRRTFEDFQLVHLVRDPRGVCWSRIRGSVELAKRFGGDVNESRLCTVGAFGWTVANLACELFGWLYPNQYMRIHYEEIAQSPRDAMGSIFDKILPGRKQAFERINVNGNRHQLFGNGVRVKQVAIADIREDDEWRERLPTRRRRLVERLSVGLRGRYGYN